MKANGCAVPNAAELRQPADLHQLMHDLCCHNKFARLELFQVVPDERAKVSSSRLSVRCNSALKKEHLDAGGFARRVESSMPV